MSCEENSLLPLRARSLLRRYCLALCSQRQQSSRYRRSRLDGLQHAAGEDLLADGGAQELRQRSLLRWPQLGCGGFGRAQLLSDRMLQETLPFLAGIESDRTRYVLARECGQDGARVHIEDEIELAALTQSSSCWVADP